MVNILVSEGKVLTKPNGKVCGIQENNSLKKLLDATKSAQYLFKDYSGTSVDDLIKYNDTENVEKFDHMFDSCSNIINFPLINTSKCKSMSYMFDYCRKAETLPNIDTSKNTTLEYTYCQCVSLKYLQKLNTDTVYYWTSAFRQCQNLPKIDISRFQSSSTTYTSQMCDACYLLKAFIIRSFGSSYSLYSSAFRNCYHMLGTVNATFNPLGVHDGYVYVPRDMIETLQSATNWSALQFRALEDYTVDGTTTGEFDDEKAGI